MSLYVRAAMFFKIPPLLLINAMVEAFRKFLNTYTTDVPFLHFSKIKENYTIKGGIMSESIFNLVPPT